MKAFRTACRILFWGFAISGVIAIWAVPPWARALVFLSICLCIFGFGFLIRLSRKIEAGDFKG